MFANLLAGLASGGTIAIGAVRILALRNQHRQLNAKTYIESSGRFQELLRSFPTELGLLTPILLILRGQFVASATQAEAAGVQIHETRDEYCSPSGCSGQDRSCQAARRFRSQTGLKWTTSFFLELNTLHLAVPTGID